MESPSLLEDLLVTLLLEVCLSCDLFLVHLSIALSRGTLRGEAFTLSCILEGVIDLRLLGSGIEGLSFALGVCKAETLELAAELFDQAFWSLFFLYPHI
jgi:hypothetical protein